MTGRQALHGGGRQGSRRQTLEHGVRSQADPCVLAADPRLKNRICVSKRIGAPWLCTVSEAWPGAQDVRDLFLKLHA
jgi:hypothetical protein